MTFRIQTLVIRQLTRQLGSLSRRPQLSAHLRDDLGLDSLDFCALLNQLEDTLRIVLPDDDPPGLRTVADLVRYVERCVPSRR